MTKIYTKILFLSLCILTSCDYDIIPDVVGSDNGQNPISNDSNNLIACFKTDKTTCNFDSCKILFDATCSKPPNEIETYKWDFDGNGVFSNDNNISTSFNYDKQGTYKATLQVVGKNGFTKDTSVTITVYDIRPDFQIPSGIIYDNCEIIFNNTSSGFSNYFWNFGNGDTSTLENPIYNYASPGTYTVILEASYNGISNSTEKQINVTESIKFDKTIDYELNDSFEDMVLSPDQNYIAIGSSSDFYGDDNVYFIKMNQDGDVIITFILIY